MLECWYNRFMEHIMNNSNGFFAELERFSGVNGQDGRGLSKIHIF